MKEHLKDPKRFTFGHSWLDIGRNKFAKRPKYAFYCFLNPTPLILAHVEIPTQPLFREVLNISGLGLTTKTDLPVKTTVY